MDTQHTVLNSRWSRGEDDELIAAYEDGLTLADIAITLGRSQGDIAKRIEILQRRGDLEAVDAGAANRDAFTGLGALWLKAMMQVRATNTATDGSAA